MRQVSWEPKWLQPLAFTAALITTRTMVRKAWTECTGSLTERNNKIDQNFDSIGHWVTRCLCFTVCKKRSLRHSLGFTLSNLVGFGVTLTWDHVLLQGLQFIFGGTGLSRRGCKPSGLTNLPACANPISSIFKDRPAIGQPSPSVSACASLKVSLSYCTAFSPGDVPTPPQGLDGVANPDLRCLFSIVL